VSSEHEEGGLMKRPLSRVWGTLFWDQIMPRTNTDGKHYHRFAA
jgi:hypothetical protein